MATAFQARPVVLFLGDLVSFYCALWITLYLRGFTPPPMFIVQQHLVPFTVLFFIWTLIFMVAGLYESRSVIFARRALSATLLVAQTVNILFAALFFFFIPLFGIAPKTILVIYLFISFPLILLWRVVIFPWLRLQQVENAIVVGSGKEVLELTEALRHAPRAPARVMSVINPESANLSQTIKEEVRQHNARFIIADFENARVAQAFPELYNFLARGIRFFDALPLYEQVFGRVPLSVLGDEWLARNVSRYAHTLYDSLKRAMDILAGIIGLALFIVLAPFILLAIWLEGGGRAIIALPRVGEGGVVFNLYKFRSMSGNDAGNYGAQGASKLSITRVGRVLRKTRLDELPQVFNIARGDLSLIGPRPETPALVEVYAKNIPYYGVRHLVRPGLSGWAQLYYHADPHHAADVEATKMKLSFDLYYLKHRSLGLDVLIALKTIRRLLIGGNA